MSDMPSMTQAGVVWGFLAFILCLICGVFVPISFVNVVIGLAVGFVAMTVYNAKFGQPY